MPPLIIKKGDRTPVSRNFTANEFYCKSADAPASHSFPSELVEAVQFLRDYFNTPWRVTSGVRTPAHELRICQTQKLDLHLVTSSQHVKRRAVDSRPKNRDPAIMATLQHDLLQRGPIFQKLRQIGVRGFGVYDGFVHLDIRVEPGKQHDELGTYAFWNNMVDSPKKTTPSPTKKAGAVSVASSLKSPLAC